jgi:hypothetical protein
LRDRDKVGERVALYVHLGQKNDSLLDQQQAARLAKNQIEVPAN